MSATASRTQASVGSGRFREGWLALAIIALALVAYIPAFSAGFIWDDDQYVYHNFALRSAEGLWRIWTVLGEVPQYYPLTHTTFWIEHQLWGNAPFGYHVTNILLHSASAFILWRLLRMLEVPGAWFAAALFAVHPVHVESVAWVTERKNVLSGFFYLLAFAALWRSLGRPDEQRPTSFAWRPYALALVLFLCALLSKTVTSTLPAAALLVLWWKRGRIRWQDIAVVTPLFLMGAALGSVTSWMEREVVGAVGEDWNLSLAERVLIAGRAVWFYAGKLVWPEPLIFIYPKWTLNTGSVVQWLYPAAAAAVPVLLWIFRKRLGRGPLVAVLFFAGTLTPALGFFNIFPMRYSYVADHFQYLPSIGLLTLIAALAVRCVPRAALRPAVAAVLLVLSALTFRYCFAYQDLKTLWTDTLAKNPNAWMAASNLGSVRLAEAQVLPPEQQAEKMAQARDLFERSLTIRPDNPTAMVALGVALYSLGEQDRALELWHAVDGMKEKTDPRLWPNVASDAQFQLGWHYHRVGDLQLAQEHYHRALQIQPGHTRASTQLAAILAQAGDFTAAQSLLQRAAKADPDSPTIWTNMGNVLLQSGDPAKAKSAYARALAIQPQHVPARYGYAVALAGTGDVRAAEAQLRSLLADRPNLPDALASLGTILAGTGRQAEARQYLERALAIRPDHPQALQQLDQLNARQQ